jgi:hypothetical protein
MSSRVGVSGQLRRPRRKGLAVNSAEIVAAAAAGRLGDKHNSLSTVIL